MSELSRRGFLSMLVGGVAATAAVRTFPFHVFSFPSEVKIAPAGLTAETLNEEYNKVIAGSELPDLVFVSTPIPQWLKTKYLFLKEQDPFWSKIYLDTINNKVGA